MKKVIKIAEFESENSIIKEGRSITKISKELSDTISKMKELAPTFSSLEGKEKDKVRKVLLDLTANKKELLKELDDAVLGKDKDIELELNEIKFNKQKLMKAVKKDDGYIQLGNGEEYIIYKYDNGNKDNDDMWKDKVIIALDQDGGEHEVEYSDIVSYDESKLDERFIQTKRKYTENHPSKTVGFHAKARNKILEAIKDGKITQDEFDNIIREFSKDGKRWLKRNGKMFNVSENGISLSKFGKRILKGITVNEASIELDAIDPKNKVFLKQLKRHKVKMKVVGDNGPGGGATVIELTGKKEDLEDIVSNPIWGWDDPELAEFIEEGITENKNAVVSTFESFAVNEESSLHKRFNKMVNNNLEDVVEILIQLDKIEYNDRDKLSYYEIHANQVEGASDIKDSLTDYSDKKLKDVLKAFESVVNEAKEGMQKSDSSKAKKLFSDIEKNQSDLLSNAKKLESVLEKYYAGGDNIHNVENGGKEDKLSRDASSYAVHSEAVLSETTGRQKLGHYFSELKKALK